MVRLILNWKGVDLVTRELVDDFVTIGRAPLNQILIDHLTVSTQHAVLMRVGDSYWLKDLNSTNGIQINGVLATEADLKDGDKIRFGPVKAVFAGCSRKRWSPARLESSARVLQQDQNPRPQLEGILRGKCNSMIRAKKNLDRLRMTP